MAAAIEEKMSTRNAATDSAKVSKIISDYAVQKKEIVDLSAEILSLTEEIRALKQAKRNASSEKEQDAPRHPYLLTNASASDVNARRTRGNGRTVLSTTRHDLSPRGTGFC